MHQMRDREMSFRECSEYTGIAYAKVRRWPESTEHPPLHRTPTGRWYVIQHELEAWLLKMADQKRAHFVLMPGQTLSSVRKAAMNRRNAS